MASRVSQALHALFFVVGAFLLAATGESVSACESNTSAVDATPKKITGFFNGKNKTVVTFVGYSGAEYEDRKAMLATAESVLNGFDSSKTLVNIGGTVDGIGAIYPLAKDLGFVTTGIVSTQAKKYGAKLSECVDYVFYVEDLTWGGFNEGDGRLSPTSTAMVEVSDILIGIGGGEVARDELIAARHLGKEVRFFPADMNHQKAREKAIKQNLPVPVTFRGAADEEF